MRIDTTTDSDRLHVLIGDVPVLTYVHTPTEVQLESPRPYALLATIDGVAVTAYRPEDHVWHKGLSLALPVVGEHNFWGGPTYVADQGYVQLANNGAQVHRGFAAAEPGDDGVIRIVEHLDWVADDGAEVLVERRVLTARQIDAATWAMTWHTTLRNVSGAALGFGSPTSKGRPNAGYCGIFWRGPSAFTGGQIIAPSGPAGDAARGEPGPWLAFVAPDRTAGVLMMDGDPTANPWFARSEEYAGLNPAPFFFTETEVLPDEQLVLAAALIIGGPAVADLADTAGASLLAELRSTSTQKVEYQA